MIGSLCRGAISGGRLLVCLFGLVVLGGCAGGRNLAPAAPAATAPVELPAAHGVAEDPLPVEETYESFVESDGVASYRVGAGDVLEITTWEKGEAKPVRAQVREDGTLAYGFLPDQPVAGLTVRRIEERLSQALTPFLRQVRLTVRVAEYHAHPVLLFGEVKTPGRYPLQGRTTLLDLLLAAGSFSDKADLANVQLVRDGRRYRVNLLAALSQGAPAANPVLDGGDLVTVPRLAAANKKVYVFGQVARVGVYPFEDSLDLLGAVAKAGGFTRDAVTSDVRVIRDYRGRRQVYTADLQRLLRRGDLGQNLTLADGDVVFVPQTAAADINDFIARATPLLDFLLYPGRYRDMYLDSDTLRVLSR